MTAENMLQSAGRDNEGVDVFHVPAALDDMVDTANGGLSLEKDLFRLWALYERRGNYDARILRVSPLDPLC